jgi:hypothetical protein
MTKNFWITVSAFQAVAICVLIGLLLNPAESSELEPIGGTSVDASEAAADPASESLPSRPDSLVPEPSSSRRESADEPSSSPSPRPLRKIGALIYGVALDENDNPAEDVHANIVVAREGTPQFKVISIQRDGSFTIAGVSPGRWKLRAKAEGMRPIEQVLTIKPDEEFRRHDFMWQRAVKIPVRVLTPDGTPFVDALVKRPGELWGNLSAVATTERPGGDLPPTQWRRHRYFGVGEFSSRGQSDAPVDVKAGTIGYLDLGTQEPPVFVSLVMRSAVLATKLVAAEGEEVVFTLSLEDLWDDVGFFRGQIVDGRTGEPLPGAFVNHGDRNATLKKSPVDEGGRFLSVPIAPGLVRVMISAKGFGIHREMILLKPGETFDLGSVALFPSTSISGRVVNAKGEGVKARLKWSRPESGDLSRRSDGWFGTFTQDGGHFEITRLLPGPVFLSARVEDEGRVWTTLNLGAEGVRDVRLQLSADISTLRLSPTFGAREMRRVEIREAEGRILKSYEQIGTWVIDERLPFGRYSVRGFQGARVVLDQVVNLGEKLHRIDVP